MTNTQITLIQTDNYGPWTVTPEPRREVDLQTLQSWLYADLSQLIGNREGYIFFTRFDNMIAVTNGLNTQSHKHIQESIGNRYSISVSLSIAAHPLPSQALDTATEQLQAAGSAQDNTRKERLKGTTVSDDHRSDSDVQIAHFDVNDATKKYTDRLNAFDTFIHIEQGYTELMRYMYREHDSLSFFVGGDNVIAVCSSLMDTEFSDAIAHVSEEVDVELKAGVGHVTTAQEAGMAAKHALATCRREGDEVYLME